LEPGVDLEGDPEPQALEMTPEAKALWVDYYNRHRAEGAELDDDLAAAWSKLEAYTARFALIFQLCSWTAGDAQGEEVDETSMATAIELSDWFGGEAKRVYGLFAESDQDAQRRELVELIQRKGGRTTARELAHGSRRYRGAGDAEAALEGLLKIGWGRWVVEPTGGRPAQVFVLNAAHSGHGNESVSTTENPALQLPLPPFPEVSDQGRQAAS
jgi:hypothetical protein